MLDRLPSEVWTNPRLKWFDPAGGMGNFLVMVYLRLMRSLEAVFPDPESRKKHILEHQLYMSELSPKNIEVYQRIFNAEGRYILNLYEGDTLELDPQAYWGVEQFDIIVGNPPYNFGGIRSHTGEHLGEKNETIWPKFLERSLLWLKTDGYLCFIHPLTWLKRSNKIRDKLLDKHIIWLKIWDNIKSLSELNGKIPVSIYILHNRSNVKKLKTIIISEIQSKKIRTETLVYLDKQYSIPIAYHSIFSKLCWFIETHKLKIEYHSKTVKSSGDRMPLPAQYGIGDRIAVDTFTEKDGLQVKIMTTLHPDTNKQKLIIANKSSFRGFNCWSI